jgi:hypothetical protein
MDFYSAWQFLSEHRIFNTRFEHDLWFDVVKVDPETGAINLLDRSKNTKVEVWLEHGPYDASWGGCTHDIDLDCGGDTFEDAIIALAKLVKQHYTDDGTKICIY